MLNRVLVHREVTMHKTFLLFVVAATVVLTPLAASDVDGGIGTSGFGDINAPRMTAAQMKATEGSILVRGTQPDLRLHHWDWKETPERPDRDHCDVIARNRAEELGFDTSNPDGSYVSYNDVTVDRIYRYFGRVVRTPTPQPGTAGYIFTGGDSGKTHLQFYDYRGGGSRYDRYSNRSRAGTESVSSRSPSYMPTVGNVSRQAFVPLARRIWQTRWSR